MSRSARAGILSRWRFDLAVLAAALLVGLTVAAAVSELPIAAAGAAAATLAGIVIFGPELIIGLSLVAAAGLVPFLDGTDFIVPQVKGYFLFFWIAVGTMVIAWAARLLAKRPAWAPRPNLLLVLVLVQLGYVGLLMLATDPLAQPTLAAPFVEFPVIAVATYLWLSHEDAVVGVKRVLPILVAIVAAWGLAYVAAAAGCGGCRTAVSSQLSHDGLLGPNSRVYTPGQNSLLALVLIAFGQLLRKPTALTVSLASLGLVCVALQGSRAQYFGVAAGMIVLIAWRMRNAPAGGKILLGVATVIAFAAILTSPVGARALTAYEDLSTGTGTGGYRIGLVERASENWSVLGTGVTTRTLRLGVNEDLGLSNTFIIVGYVGGALQIAVLLVGFVRSSRVPALAAATVAAIFAMLLVTRASLALLELGHSAITYGVTVGCAAWLTLPSRARTAARARPRPQQRGLARA
jgi:hypothetical protein